MVYKNERHTFLRDDLQELQIVSFFVVFAFFCQKPLEGKIRKNNKCGRNLKKIIPEGLHEKNFLEL